MAGQPEITEYRFQVFRPRALPEISILIETRPASTPPDGIARELERRLHTAFSLRIPVAAAPMGSLPRYEMKARRWSLK